MLTDVQALPADFELFADCCVVGAGPAGIAIARSLVHQGRTVVLLEGGGLECTTESQDLYRGENGGMPYFPLQSCRMRFLGGTTSVWGGWCRPLDPLDFHARDWVTGSGWPFQRADLDPYYRRCLELLDLGPYELGHEFWSGKDQRALPLQGGDITTQMALLSLPTRFGQKYRDELSRSGRVQLLLSANVTSLETTADGAAVVAARVGSGPGRQGRVRALHFVLAAGGIENARLLLLSDDRVKGGLGNGHDQVGRYFNEHPCIVAGHFETSRPEGLRLYQRQLFESPAVGYLATTPEFQKRHRTLNVSFFPVEADPKDPRLLQNLVGYTDRPQDLVDAWQGWEKAYRDSSRAGTQANATLRSAVGGDGSSGRFSMVAHLEQAPNPDSRVTLSSELDALGLRRARLDWRLTPLERRSLRESTQALARAMEASLGPLRIPDWLLNDDTPWPDLLTAEWHHMGTTRMGVDRRASVVTPDCQVHGIDNLHIAGSSVFPTGGTANPTFTLMALSLRLADRLEERLRA